MRTLHPCLEQAHETADAFRICPSERGYAVWRFSDWAYVYGGWNLLVSNLRTREDAARHILSKLGLSEEEPPKPQEPIRAYVWIGPTEWL